MNIRFLSACNSNATAEARVIKFGRTLCPAEVMIRDAAGKEVAIAQVTYMRLERMPKR
jgi:acyl-coenzyme A thioesterase PaaI-like protein